MPATAVPQRNRSKPVDVVIIGAGLAGIALAQELIAAAPAQAASTQKVVLIHRADAAAGSSAPSALLHFAPGRSFAVDPLQANAFAMSVAWLRRQDARFFQAQPLLRPTSGPAGERLAASLPRAGEAMEAAGVQVDVVKRDRIRALLPDAGFDEAFEVAPAFAVDLALLLAAEREKLGACIVEDEVVDVEKEAVGLSVHLESGESLQTTRVVFACGAALTRWFGIAGPIEAGELVRGFFAPGAHTLVSAGGVHVCPQVSTATTGEAWVGATRFSPTSPPADREGVARDELETKLRPHIAGFSFAADSPWMGVRLVGPDRRPVVGELSTHGVFVLAGFGATGLLWAPACAAWLAAHLVNGTDLPSALLARRSGSANARL